MGDTEASDDEVRRLARIGAWVVEHTAIDAGCYDWDAEEYRQFAIAAGDR